MVISKRQDDWGFACLWARSACVIKTFNLQIAAFNNSFTEYWVKASKASCGTWRGEGGKQTDGGPCLRKAYGLRQGSVRCGLQPSPARRLLSNERQAKKLKEDFVMWKLYEIQIAVSINLYRNRAHSYLFTYCLGLLSWYKQQGFE